MLNKPWLVVATKLLLSFRGALGDTGFQPALHSTYHNNDPCPERCIVSGPSPGNWSVYPDFRTIRHCKQTMLFEFGLYDNVDLNQVNHRIQVCSSFGPDFASLPPNSFAEFVQVQSSKDSVPAKFQVGCWDDNFGLVVSDVRSLVGQLRQYIDQGFAGSAEKPFILYSQTGQTAIGIYIGTGLLAQSISTLTMKPFEDNLENFNISSPSLVVQLCGTDYDSAHVFGMAITSNSTFFPIQNAIRTWSKAECLAFSSTTNITGRILFNTPSMNSSINGTLRQSNSTMMHLKPRGKVLQARNECSNIQGGPGLGCPELAVKCGISPHDFTTYNPNLDCSKVGPFTHVCCSSGELPDFRRRTNNDGTCTSYLTQPGDNCDDLAAKYGLTRDDLNNFNQKTWGWSGCNPLHASVQTCLSAGTPPFPAPIANAACGPQVPGTQPSTDGTNIAKLNSCPLNACCNIWGQCGVTNDFCVDTNTGPPGTAKDGTFGCISNCGTDIIKGSGTGALKVTYFEANGFNRQCLFQDASQIDTSRYTHVHFGFGTLTADYQVQTGNALSTY